MKRQKTITSRINYKYPVRSFLNYSSVRLCYAIGTDKVVGYPSKILFEPTSSCNLKCPLCPTGRGTLNRADGFMSLDQFKGIIDEIAPYTTHVEMGGYGEPLLNENIFPMIRYATDKGIYVNMHSNVNLIDTPEKVRDLVASGLYHLTLSVDGATQKTYHRYRVGGNVETVVANAKAIMQERNRSGSERPFVTMQTVVTKVNEHEVDQIREIAEDVGVDAYKAKKASLSMTRPKGAADVAPSIISHWLPSKRYHRHNTTVDKMNFNGCDWLYKRCLVYWNGDITTCCFDASAVNKMGNIFEAGSFWNVWNGPVYQKVRREVNTDIRSADPLCSVCPNRVVVQPAE